MFGKLQPGASIGLHRHEGSSEIIFIQEGKGKVLFEGKDEHVEKGDVHYCPEGCRHSLINDSDDDLIYFAVVDVYKRQRQYMVILIAGSSHTGKTLLAQRLLEKYKYPYLSIDHLKTTYGL